MTSRSFGAELLLLFICHFSRCYLAYPGSTSTGEAQLFDAFNLRAKATVAAHESSLAALAFNPAGDKLATASERGTVIRVFSTVDGMEGRKLAEFRRGVKRCASVQCLAFSQDSKFLVLSSNTETIHLFRCEFDPDSSGGESGSAENRENSSNSESPSHHRQQQGNAGNK